MSYWWSIYLPVRYSYKRGMQGSDIAALQLNLGLHVDGDFGAATEDAVKRYQRIQELAPDGVAGPKTFQRICVQRSYKASETYSLPNGLLKSFVSSESAFILGAVSRHPNDSGWDVGAYQISSGPVDPPPQDLFIIAYDVSRAAERSAKEARDTRDSMPRPVDSRYLNDLAGGDRNKFKWQLVALNHNWPYAAYWIPRRGHIFNDPAADDKWTDWISEVTNGRLTTPREWVAFQVETKTVYL